MDASVYQFRPGAVLRFTGEDHAGFLQGQGTADLRGQAAFCRYCLWLDHRGLIQGDGFVLRESASAMLVVSYATPASGLLARFQRHIIADDVEIEDLTGAMTLVSCPRNGRQVLAAACGLAEPEHGQLGRGEAAFLFNGRRLGRGTLDLLQRDPVPDRLAALPEMAPGHAEALRIADGIPLIPLDCPLNTFNPVEAGILSAVSLTKGCFLGQEVVARVHRLERLTRRLAHFSGAALATLPAGPLRIAGQEVGGIFSVAKNADKQLAIGWLKSKISDGPHDFDGSLLRAGSLGPS